MVKYLCITLLCLAGCAARPATPETQNAATDRRPTGRNLDLAIVGNGYFIVQTEAGGFLFTRNGELAVSGAGELVNNDGYRLYPVVDVQSAAGTLMISADGGVRRTADDGVSQLVGQIILSRFNHPDRLTCDGEYCMPTPESGEPITGKPGTKGLGNIVSGELEQ